MTLAKASALTVGFFATVALGVGIGPYIVKQPATAEVQPAAAAAAVPLDGPVKAPKAAPAARRIATPAAPDILAVPAIAPSAPELHARLKPVLNKGADMTIASSDFPTGERFAAVAHAARNTEIPFMLLKQRVVTEGKSLADAIRESRPEINAEIEAHRAEAEAKSDLASLG